LIDRFWCSTLSPNTSRSDGDEILRLAGAAVASSARLAERSLGVLVGTGTADGSSFIRYYCPRKTTGSETWYCGCYYLICHSHTIWNVVALLAPLTWLFYPDSYSYIRRSFKPAQGFLCVHNTCWSVDERKARISRV
jgi:hypothetical protein